MSKKQELETLLADLQKDMKAVNANPLVPGTVKQAVNTTLRILEILILEADHG